MMVRATLWTIAPLLLAACSSSDGTPGQNTLGNTGVSGSGASVGVAGSVATAGVSAGVAGSAAIAGTGVSAGSGAIAGSGAAGTSASAGSGAAGSGGPALPATFSSVYTNALSVMCPSCHFSGGVFPSLDLSSQSAAFSALVNKDASTAMNNACAGKGKLVTPGNCDTSILYSKITAAKPLCGNRMPLGATPLPQNVTDAVCAWIKAGATQN
jgi:hypothetical protein